MKASEARDNWSEVLTQVFREKSRVVVERSGVPIAAVVSAADLSRLQHLDEERERRFAAVEQFAEAFEDVPEAEIEMATARAIAEIRRQNRPRHEAHTPPG